MSDRVNTKKRAPVSAQIRHARARAARLARGTARKILDRAATIRPHRGPLVTVVVPMRDVEQYLERCLTSLAEQSHRRLRVVVVDDGSRDRSRDIAAAFARRDRRFLLLTQAPAGVGAARDRGAEYARGRYLAFVDADDTLPPRAMERMASALESSGSDFAIGAVAVQSRGIYREPRPIRRAHSRRLDATSLEASPFTVGNLFPGARLFRRDFWRRHELRFGARGSDATTMARAMVLAMSFDVLPGVVYRWAEREDYGSLRQRALSDRGIAVDLLRDLHQAATILAENASAKARQLFFAEVFEQGLPDLIRGAMWAGRAYWDALVSETRKLLDAAPSDSLAHVSVETRLLVWLCAHDHLDAVEAIFDYTVENPNGYPFEVGTDGTSSIVVPALDEFVPDLDRRLLRLAPRDMTLRTRLTGFGWESPTVMRIEGGAFIEYVDDRVGPPRIDLLLVDDEGEVVERVETEFDERADVDSWAHRSREDHQHSGFRAFVDCEVLLNRARATDAGILRAELDVRHGGIRRQGRFTRRNGKGSASLLVPSLVDGEVVQPTWVEGRGFVVGLGTGVHALVDLSMRGDSVTLDVASRSNLATLRVLDGVQPLSTRLERVGHNRWRGRLPVPASLRDGSGECPIVVEDGAGRRRPVRWALQGPDRDTFLGTAFIDPSGEEPQAVVRRGAAQVRVDTVDVDVDTLVLAGTCTGPIEIALVGPRASSAWHRVEQQDGRFTVRIATLVDEWGWGPRPLPTDDYEVRVRPPHGRTELPARAGRALHAVLPLSLPGKLLRFSPGATSPGELSVRIEPAPLTEEMGSRRQRVIRDTVYAAALQKPLLPIVLFESFKAHSGGDHPRAICEEMLRDGTDLEPVWSVVDHSVPIPAGARAVVRNTEEWYDLLARASHLVFNSTMPRWFQKRPDQVYLQTWHGTPLKKVAHDRQNMDFENWRHRRHLVYETRTWDFLLAQSEFCAEALRAAFRYEGRILDVGYPRNDILRSPQAEQVRAKTRDQLGIAANQRAVLYAPTWRDAFRVGGVWRKVLYLDSRRLVDSDPDLVLLVRGHYHTIRAAETIDADSRILDVTRYPDIAPLYLAADVLITDYSSVFFDFALTQRPMLFLVPDLEHYRTAQRGFYLDFEEVVPGPVLADTDAVVEALRGPDRYAARRREFVDRFAPRDDGHASRRVVEAVFAQRSMRGVIGAVGVGQEAIDHERDG